MHAGGARRGDRSGVAQSLLTHELGGARRVVCGKRLDPGLSQVALCLSERLRMRHGLLDVALLHAGQRQQRVTHAEAVLAEDVNAAVVAQHQIIVDVDRPAERVLHGHGGIVHGPGRQRPENLVERRVANGVDCEPRGMESIVGGRLAVRARLALVRNGH